MKTYLLDVLNKIKRFDETLDIKTVLCNKPWVVFDETDSRQSYIFKEDGGLVITSQGKGRETSWEYLSANKTVKFKEADNSVELYHPTCFDESLLVLNLDGTEEYAVLLNLNVVRKPLTLDEIIVHINELESNENPGPTPQPAKVLPAKTPSKQKAQDDREPVIFAGETFFPAERDGKRFYVNREQRYAFSTVEHIFDKAVLVRNKELDYLFYYNDSLENVYKTMEKPTWKEYWDGKVLDGIFLGRRFLYRDGEWFKCSYVYEGCYKIEKNDGEPNEYFGDAGDHLFVITQEKVDTQKKEQEDEEKTVKYILISVVVIIIVIIIIAALLNP